MKNPRAHYASGISREAEGLTDLEPEIHIYANSRENAKNSLFHEIQHAIQEIEGFAKGGSPKSVAFSDFYNPIGKL